MKYSKIGFANACVEATPEEWTAIEEKLQAHPDIYGFVEVIYEGLWPERIPKLAADESHREIQYYYNHEKWGNDNLGNRLLRECM